MEDPSSKGSSAKSWLDRLNQLFSGEPKNREDLLHILREAEVRNLLDPDALGMLEGVLQVSEIQVRDIMIPRSQVVVLNRNDPLETLLPIIIESGHSRFPVIDESKDDIVGVLLAKDLLRAYLSEDKNAFNLRDLLRTPVFVPESKRLNVLLKEFRASKNHLAVVVDEYGGVSGIVTIEDVLEQIVGEIEDEHDIDEDRFIFSHRSGIYTVKALTPIEDFNEYFGTHYSDEEFDTIGGLVMNGLGYLPKTGDAYQIDQFCFTVVRADHRRIHLLRLTIVKKPLQEAIAPAGN